MDAESVGLVESGTFTMSDVVWDRTKLTSAAIAPLAAQPIVGRLAVRVGQPAPRGRQRQL
ncbi:methenyltetrahydromethanopterin cyclohydrolase [Cryobacterium psychrotolerans]|nr:methenyltetrahydromethanopterin cyclohydrolase [Cryobacterium psychrotolerans]